mmetsp:Transcript_30353/g.33670  ORF Transcript_30353/g.33670 Transcript_30353/m.33670 type:complete len:301 (-) Transcript_30353:683-1585(-)
MLNGEDEVHLVQKLLTVNEVFIYRIPHLKSAGGHRAEDWDLANPLQTCVLNVERMDNSCVVNFLVEKINENGVGSNVKLFAQSIIVVTETQKLEYFLEIVTDSSRYFVVKIEDIKTGRTAHIGVGFRERDDASDFRMALQDYERSMKRQIRAEAMTEGFEKIKKENIVGTEGKVSDNNNSYMPYMSGLTFENKIHLNIEGHEKSGDSTRSKKKANKPSDGDGTIPLLKPPPPPANANAVDASSTENIIFVSLKDTERKELKPTSEVDSICAVASEVNTLEDVDVEEEDDWTEFESSTTLK